MKGHYSVVRLFPFKCRAYQLVAIIILHTITLSEPFLCTNKLRRGNFPSWSKHVLHNALRNTISDPSHVLSEEDFQTITRLIQDRGIARWENNFERADQLKVEAMRYPLPDGFALAIEDLPRSKGGGSVWHLCYEPIKETSNNSTKPTILQLAHTSLGLAVSCSEKMSTRQQKLEQLEPIVKETKLLLQDWRRVQSNLPTSMDTNTVEPGWYEVETTLRGRKAADAAFWFALAGVTDNVIFELLAEVCAKEIMRFGSNQSCRSKDIIQMMDRFSAAGLRRSRLEEVAEACLRSKSIGTQEEMIEFDHLLDLHSDRSLLMLWKFAARQKKQQAFLKSALRHWEASNISKVLNNQTKLEQRNLKQASLSIDWTVHFQDPTRPLVVDIGCGMGISLLGLATCDDDETQVDQRLNVFKDCNFIGVDLSSLAIGYAQGIADRWGISNRLSYVVESAETFIPLIRDTYPGPVRLCLIQFPTPYRFPNSSRGNSQLPDSMLEGFMVSQGLLKMIYDVLSVTRDRQEGSRGFLHLQSNCEDVALQMKESACAVGFESETMQKYATLADISGESLDDLPQRTRNWIKSGGERAAGSSWSSESLLPPIGSTETEVACRINRTPIHRCLLRPKC